MFVKVLYAIVITIFIIFIGGFFLPESVHVERDIEIDRPVSTVFVLLNSLRTFSDWSPWAERDPNAVYRFSGPDQGVGAHMAWSGDPRLVGDGWQEIIESQAFNQITMQLDFDQQGRAISTFDLERTLSGCHLTWGFDSNLAEGQSFIGGLFSRYFGLFFDQWIGQDYERGLARLKVLAESLPAADFSDLEAEIVDVKGTNILYIPTSGGQEDSGISLSLSDAFEEITRFMVKHSIEMKAQPMTITRAWDASDHAFYAAIPVTAGDYELSGHLEAGISPSGRAVRVVHRGPYERMTPTYEKLAAFMAAHGLPEGRVSWEHYISDPGQTAPNEIITHIYFLVDENVQEQSES